MRSRSTHRRATISTQTPRSRRGAAILLVMLATIGIAALALSAIFMQSSAVLMTKYYDKERDFRYASEQAIQQGLAQMQMDTGWHLPDSGFVTVVSNGRLKDAYGNFLPTVRVNLYAGQSGTNTGQFGQFASLVAQAQDSLGNTRYVRRLEVEEDNFARFAMFTNQFSSGLCYGPGEFIKGVGMSNQIWQSCNNPTYYDTISAHSSVNQIGSPAATYIHGYKQNVPVIPMPTVAKLANLPTYAANANMSFTSVAKGTRIEFYTVNMNPSATDTTETDPNEGFFRVFNDTSGNGSGEGVAGSGIDRAYAYYNDSSASTNNWSVYNDQCGDWHTVGGRVMFFPVAVHNQAWFKGGVHLGTITGWVGPLADTIHTTWTAANRAAIMGHTTPRQARCYPSGDPHLVAVERNTASGYAAADTAKGGEDSTFTPVNRNGYWTAWPGTVPAGLTPALTCGMQSVGNTTLCPPGINRIEEGYLFPLYRAYNANTKGVIYFNGDVAASGWLTGFITLYTSGSVWFTDDLVYSANPTTSICANELGVIAAQNLWIPNNSINRPQNPTNPASPTGAANSVFMSDNKNFYLDAVTMALGSVSGTGSFQVENYGGGALSMTTCSGQNSGGGCIDQIGGVIEQFISATWNGTNSGFPENRAVDPCLVKQSPPYFPLTGKYAANRYYELDPSQFNIDSLFKHIQTQ
jgi:hypothetical protein